MGKVRGEDEEMGSKPESSKCGPPSDTEMDHIQPERGRLIYDYERPWVASPRTRANGFSLIGKCGGPGEIY